MKKSLLTVCCVALALSGAAAGARAQSGTVAAGPAVARDADAEKSAKHELEVARHYFHNKKAYLASYKRADELIAGYPEFSKLDEVLYIAGMSGFYLSQGKGKQALPKAEPGKQPEFTPEDLRENARAYLSRLVKDYPKSSFRKEAEETLSQLGGAKEEKQQ
ncbi:MAG TPA: outer membrane protein assembly factor BamD [Pyrinomonadaceae bacterium]|jgi:outer membrane protein assembly factor BamD (BamD/ComL family)|nr:outer membrane protein assembly factor BamD [Pyrinomonadaceae bacterium]